jgi:hypothetical protein
MDFCKYFFCFGDLRRSDFLMPKGKSPRLKLGMARDGGYSFALVMKASNLAGALGQRQEWRTHHYLACYGGAMSCAKSFNISKQEVMAAWQCVKSIDDQQE